MNKDVPEWGNSTQMTIISTSVGKNPLEEMEQLSESTRIRNAVLWCNLKNGRKIFVHFQGKPFSLIVIQVHSPVTDAKEAEVDGFCEDL